MRSRLTESVIQAPEAAPCRPRWRPSRLVDAEGAERASAGDDVLESAARCVQLVGRELMRDLTGFA